MRLALEDKALSVVGSDGEGDRGLWIGVGVKTSLACTGGESMKLTSGVWRPLSDWELLFLAETLRTVSFSCDRCR